MNRRLIFLSGLCLLVVAATVFTRAPANLDTRERAARPEAFRQGNPVRDKILNAANTVTPTKSGDVTVNALNAFELQAQLSQTSLHDTELPIPPAVDEQGALIIDSRLRDSMDYFLMLEGEKDQQTRQQLLYSFLTLHLPAPAVAQGMEIFDRYQTLLTTPDGDALADEDNSNATQRFQAISEQRRKILGDSVAEAFFGEDEAYDRYSLEKMQAYRDFKDDAEALDGWTDANVAQLPPGLRARHQEQRRQQELAQQIHALTEQGAVPAEIYQTLMLQENTEAAERYQTLMEQREQWQKRVNAYKAQREFVNENNIDPQQRERELQQWMAERFSDYEILRIHSIERMEQGG